MIYFLALVILVYHVKPCFLIAYNPIVLVDYNKDRQRSQILKTFFREKGAERITIDYA